jgi:hypothetical protein
LQIYVAHTLLVAQSKTTHVVQIVVPFDVSIICFTYCTAFSIPVTMVNALEKNKAKERPSKNTMVNLGNKFLFLNGL